MRSAICATLGICEGAKEDKAAVAGDLVERPRFRAAAEWGVGMPTCWGSCGLCR